MKSVMFSIKPKYCELIASGKKTIEVRKNRPNIDTPFKCYIYCKKNKKQQLVRTADSYALYGSDRVCPDKLNGKVIGEFVCDKIYQYTTCDAKDGVDISDEDMTRLSYLTKDEIRNYELSPGHFGVFGWHISDLVIYAEPKELSEFISFCPEYEKEKFTAKCIQCKHYYINDYDMCVECDCEGEKRLTRPPQSWCYVEDC